MVNDMPEILDRWGKIALALQCSERTAMRAARKRKNPLPVKYDSLGHPIITKEAAIKWRLHELAA